MPRPPREGERTRFSYAVSFLQHRIEQHGDDDDGADHDLLEERRYTEQVQAVPEHTHDERADERTGERALAAHEARSANYRCGDRVELVHHSGDRLRRV